ncbi:ArpU family phage packaging/lysis transcriptional regulator [Enterococcus pallens]|uniref:ArpU family phage transcriptional regulator n=1 Tax=Enterococcus pallens ATCC BAA-351 TaxID=1158607 RepID=R2PTR1_9ENTE|nr:ArpU family phage packaging/lysis transcriptional regulator [Enterococcus pallens]EOH86713.1 ArpU family phage transcriptional regulator [Enterococcus pallens ATCC BAA-351]EOU18509.1 ArpU family phage transcriptional regulator [Enterococcus pallens ATCC BAA-351]OJG76528.1 ArpU family phage transcriptional regulator [Enterococcus pallens]
MIALLKEVDFHETRKNARAILKSFRRLERIAGRSLIDVRSPIITDMPRIESYGNRSEDALIQVADAEAERDLVITALMALGLTSRQVLHYTYCSRDHYSNRRIADELGYSVRQIERMKSDALVEFAESYCNGKLIVYY